MHMSQRALANKCKVTPNRRKLKISVQFSKHNMDIKRSKFMGRFADNKITTQAANVEKS